jgi:tetratricopeptide (TPR) repeat protein
LADLVQNKQSFTANELAEFHYQTACLYMLQGSYNLAEEQYKLAYETDVKDRYHLGYLGSKFKLEDSLPPVQELEEIVNLLSNDSYQKCFLKAKSLALLNKEKEAITLLQNHYPDEIAGQMVIYTMKGMGDELDQIIAKHSDYVLSAGRDTFVFNTMIARRYFYKATQAVLLDEEVVPFQGKPQYDLQLMQNAFIFLQKAWGIARELGYPSDITILLDISPLIYGYFAQLDKLEKYIEEMLNERPTHPDLIRHYSRILF